MSLETWKDSCRRLVEEMKPMTFRQKADHLFTYYKEYLLIVLAVIALIALIISTTAQSKRQIAMSGVLCNVTMSIEGYNHLTQDFFQRQGFDSSYQDVHLSALELKISENMSASQIDNAYYAAMGMLSMVEDKELDYAILSEDAFGYFLSQEIYMDLRDFFTAQELEQWKDYLVYARADDANPDTEEEMYPVAVNIAKLPFGQEFGDEEELVYFTVIANTQHLELCRQLWTDIVTWESKSEKSAA